VDRSLAFFAGAGRFGSFAGALAVRAVTPPLYPRAAVHYAGVTAWRCLLPVLAVTLPCGMVIALQGLQIFDLYGAQRLLSSLVSVAVLRELSPVMACVLVAAQGGSSCAAELGSMRIKEELDATEVMGVDALRFHVLPRLVGLTLACPLLGTFGALAGLLGGYITAVVLKGEASGVYLANLWQLTQPADLWGGIFKTLVFGFAIGLVATHQGYTTSGGAAGVGRAVNETVVRSVLVFVVLNYLLTSALFSGGA
jgi:phospholipid/cholesterol/gamma-HCH transport system permease protein